MRMFASILSGAGPLQLLNGAPPSSPVSVTNPDTSFIGTMSSSGVSSASSSLLPSLRLQGHFAQDLHKSPLLWWLICMPSRLGADPIAFDNERVMLVLRIWYFGSFLAEHDSFPVQVELTTVSHKWKFKMLVILNTNISSSNLYCLQTSRDPESRDHWWPQALLTKSSLNDYNENSL